MDGTTAYNPRTVEEVFRDFKGRRAGMIKALINDVEEFYQQCDPDKNMADLITVPSSSSWEFSCALEVDFKSDDKASIVYTALAVDKELQPDKVKRQMTVADGKLSVHFEAIEARFLRASFSAFMDVLTLATKTIEEFGQGRFQ